MMALVGSEGVSLTKEDVEGIFGNIEQIEALHREQLNELLERIRTWKDSEEEPTPEGKFGIKITDIIAKRVCFWFLA